MPFNRPTIAAIAARVQTDIQGALEGTAAFFRRSFERGAAAALTGSSHEMHGHLDWLARQIDVNRADDDIVQSVHGTPRGVYKKDPIAAQLTANVTGTDGVVVSATTVYQRADGVNYTVDSDVTVASGVATLALTATTTGATTNLANGEQLTIGSPIAGLTSFAVVASTTTNGADLETPAAYLARVLQRMQSPPKGGAEGDFVRWALEVPGVTRAWEYPRKEGAGTVTLYIVDDTLDPITVSGGKITQVAEYIDQPGRQPVTMDMRIYTPTLQTVDMTIHISPNNANVQAATTTQLKAVFAGDANPGGMTLKISRLNEACSIAEGEDDHAIITPPANVVIPFGSLPVLGTITWGSL